MIKSLRIRIHRIEYAFIRKIAGMIPKDNYTWAFGAWGGELFADNSKYLFEYVNKESKMIKPIWFSKKQTIVDEVRKRGYKAYLSNSLQGIWKGIRAGIVFETEGDHDVNELATVNSLVVQLWHGIGAKKCDWGKKDGHDSSASSTYKNDYWMATSDLYVKTIAELMGIPLDHFVITGFARNDTFYYRPRSMHLEELKKQHPTGKFIIYMPTHRNFGKEGNDAINLANLAYADEVLKKNNIFMVYKPHIHELENFLKYEGSFTNIILAKEQQIWGDVYSYLHYFDLLISDYSSVITDFMCTGKPVVYFPYDIERYVTVDSSLCDYFWEIPGGPMCYNWNDLLNTVIGLLQEDTWKDERERCRKLYHHFNDGNNCARVYEAVLSLLGKK